MALRHILKVGLGGLFADKLVEEAYAVSAWRLSQLVKTDVPDLVYGRNPGTYGGSGTTRGVALKDVLPEGGLAAHFDGNGYVEVSHDVGGYQLPGDAADRTLSLSGGAGDVVVMFRTSTNDATLRCLLGKTETNSSGNGWYVALQNGAVVGSLKVAGVSVFNFSRGAVADNAWHVVQLHFRRAADGGVGARIVIDGVATGADVSYSTDPAVNTGNLRFAMFNGGAAGSGFIGDIAFGMVGRNGDPSLGSRIEDVRVWTDVSDDAYRQASTSRGFGSGSIETRMSRPGQFSCLLGNFADGARLEGAYSPDHVNVTSGWRERLPILWQATDDVALTEDLFRGFISEINPGTGSDREQGQFVEVVGVSWAGLVMEEEISTAPVQTDAAAGTVFAAVIDEATIPPPAIDLAVGVSTFAFALDDTLGVSLFQVLARVVISEGGWGYERADGTVVFEAQTDRDADGTAVDDFDESELIDLSIATGGRASRVKNKIEITITPRTSSGSPPVTLGQMDARVLVPAGETVEVRIDYRDPEQPAATIGGIDIETPVSGSDFTMYANADGTGTNLTANATVTLTEANKGGSAALLSIENTGATDGYFSSIIRGVRLSSYNAQVDVQQNRESIRKNGRRRLAVDMFYQSDAALARAQGQRFLVMGMNQVTLPDGALVLADSDANEARVCQREIGDLVSITESRSGLAGALFMIADVEITQTAGSLLSGRYGFGLTPGIFFFQMGISNLDDLGSVIAPG